ncbi:MAG: aminotransferase class V-fold PLP-dependent enzyme [Patescibacteria group bacterium]|jgi:cysteine desulfurase
MVSKIYFDHAATTPVDGAVLKVMLPYFGDKFGNPSSLHGFGQEAAGGTETAREQVAQFLGCQPAEVIFTAGASEADNLAIQGIVRGSKVDCPQIITSTIEHPAILEVCRALAKEGKATVDFVKVNRLGLVEVKEVEKLITDKTVLVSIMYANNEIGTIQPIAEIGKLIKQLNLKRQNKIYFHTDAVQAVNYLNCRVDELGVDMLSLSGHKIYGPKGVGVLFVRAKTLIKPIQFGGHQEYGLRPGTENSAAIVGLGKAIELVNSAKRSAENKKIKKMRDELLAGILKNIPDAKLNGDPVKRLPNNLNISFKNIEGESAMLMLDLAGIAVSTGSACASGSLEPSHVLLALGLKHLDAHGSLRISLGKGNTATEVKKLVAVLPGIIKKLRQIAPK